MCLECSVILRNDSMKKGKLQYHQKSKHTSYVGKGRKYLKKSRASQTIRLCQEDEYGKCKDIYTKLSGL